ncbi:MAG: diguanylate cyclase [Lachnospiraceae bacterium]|nr:diguanylate cyclase [Lachnospiraceae bacterium]
MGIRFGALKEKYSHIRPGSVVFSLLVFLITVGMVSFIGIHYYDIQKEVLLQKGELNAKESAREYDRQLVTSVGIVTMVGRNVDKKIMSGVQNDEIERYLTEQTDNMTATLFPGSTGLYGWINKEYLDGSGWIPDADYVPTERPWYVETLKSEEKITFVEPYLDMQTKTIMMTVSQLLADGESVLAMDVSLDPFQEIVKRVSSATMGGQALVLDRYGKVVAHSDETQVGTNYLKEKDGLGSEVARKILVEGRMQFELREDEGYYFVYVDDLLGGMYSVSLIDYDAWKRPLRRVMVTYAIVMILLVAFLIFVFLRLNSKNMELQELVDRVEQEEKRGKEYKMLSETDRMTGLLDHVSGKRKVDELLASEATGAFLELDIDDFKSINDTCGHQVGDLAIIAVADALHNSFRADDIVIRLGGDEFGVFAVGIVDPGTAGRIIGRLFRRIESIEIAELNGRKVSVSAGVALSNGKDATFDALYARADNAMYLSKKSPGNCLTFSM